MMQMCSEERRKLAAEWAEFHTQQQLFKEQMECDRNQALQMESEREGTIKSLAKVAPRSPSPWLPPGHVTRGGQGQPPAACVRC